MYISASIFLDALFLLLGDNSNRSKTMISQLLELSDKQNLKKEIVTGDDDLVEIYKNLIKTVLAENITQDDKSSLKILLLKIKNNDVFKSYPVEKDLLTDVLTSAEIVKVEQIDQYLRRIRNILICAEADQTARKIFAKSKIITDIQDIDEQEKEIIKIKSLLDDAKKTIEQKESSSDTKASETYVSLSDEESVRRALNVFMDRSVRGIIKTGLQGLNKALGSRGGLGLGETAVFAASSHNYKSGMLVSIMVWTALYNSLIVEPGKKALIYFISLENEVNQNLMDVFRIVYCRLEKKKVDPSSLSVEFITDWLIKFFSQFNVEIFIDRYSPHEFSFKKFTQRYNAFIELGYQMVLFDLDYMSEARGIDPGDTFSLQGQIQLIKENYLKFMNHAKSQGYLLTTGHQLTKRAEEIAAQNVHAVKKFNPSLMADSSDVHRIIDILIFLQLENNVEGVKFLTVKLHKNRACKDTPESHKFFAYPFTELGIVDDINTTPGFVTDINTYGVNGDMANMKIEESAMF